MASLFFPPALRVRMMVAALLLAFGVMMALAVNRYILIEKRLDYAVSENILWAAAQNEVELGHFLLGLTIVAQAPSPEAWRALDERFDILWSRLDLYQSGVLARSIKNRPDLRTTIDALFSDLKALEPALAAKPGRDALLAIHARLTSHAGPLRNVTTAALEADRLERQTVANTQSDIKWEILLLVIALLLTISCVIVYLLRSEARARALMSESIAAREDADAAWRQLDEAIENINEGFVLFDANDRLVRCNQKYREIYALSGEKLAPGTPFSDLIRYGVEHGQFQAAMADPEGWISERLARRHSESAPFEQALGDGRWLMVSDRVTRYGGRVGIRTDITELKRHMSELETARNDLELQASRMQSLAEMAERANRSKSDFLAMVSHEIRTPMNAVLGLASLLGDTRLDPEQTGYVAGIEESGVHLLGLINNILDFSRLEAKKAVAKPVPCALRSVIGSVDRMMRVLAERKGLRLDVSVAPEIPDHLKIDAPHLTQILINLIGNAIKFTPNGRVDVGFSQHFSNVGAQSLFITIRDNGIGIPADMRERIFLPFERLTSAGRENITGTGLGLAITHKLVEMLGGTIRLGETGGNGTLFEITLPFEALPDHVPFEAARSLPPTDSALPTRPMRILVAEDTPASQLVIKTMLEKKGHTVVVTDDGQAAIEAAALDDYDLVLLDIQMPKKTGYEAASEIRKLAGSRGAVPIVALSAQAFATDRQTAFETGFDDHLAKPVRPAELADLLSLVAQGAFYRDPSFESKKEDSMADLLQELEDMCGKEVFLTLLTSAINNIAEEAQLLRQHHNGGDLLALRRSAHKMVGMLGQYASESDAASARAIEMASDAQIPAAVQAFETRISGVLNHLQTRRAKLSNIA